MSWPCGPRSQRLGPDLGGPCYYAPDLWDVNDDAIIAGSVYCAYRRPVTARRLAQNCDLNRARSSSGDCLRGE